MKERVILARCGSVLFGGISLLQLYKVFTVENDLYAIFHLYVFAVTSFFAIGLELFIMYIQYRYHRTLKREKKWKLEKN